MSQTEEDVAKIETSGVYVRARSPKGRWWSCPAEELDEESFRRFMLASMQRAGTIYGFRVDRAEPVKYRSLTEPPDRDE